MRIIGFVHFISDLRVGHPGLHSFLKSSLSVLKIYSVLQVRIEIKSFVRIFLRSFLTRVRRHMPELAGMVSPILYIVARVRGK